MSKEQGEDVFRHTQKKEHTKQVNVGGEGVAPLPFTGNPFRIKPIFCVGHLREFRLPAGAEHRGSGQDAAGQLGGTTLHVQR